MMSLPATLAFAVLVIGAVGGLLYGVYRYNKRRDAEAVAWPGVLGRVLASRVFERRTGSGDASGMNRTIFPDITYAYEVDGVAYKGRRVRFGLVTRTRKAAEAVCARYPKDAAVTVYYNPAKPKDSVLERGATPS